MVQKLFNESQSLKHELTEKSKPVQKGVISKLKDFFTVDQSDDESTHDSRVVEYLDRICTELANIFDVSIVLLVCIYSYSIELD